MDIVGISGLVVGIVGTCFGFYQYVKSRKLAEVLKTITQTFPGDVAKIEQSCAWNNVRYAHNEALKIPDSKEKNSVLNFTMLATGDTAASQRMCHQLFNQLLTFQQAQFGTREIIHQEKETLDLCRKELKI